MHSQITIGRHRWNINMDTGSGAGFRSQRWLQANWHVNWLVAQFYNLALGLSSTLSPTAPRLLPRLLHSLQQVLSASRSSFRAFFVARSRSLIRFPAPRLRNSPSSALRHCPPTDVAIIDGLTSPLRRLPLPKTKTSGRVWSSCDPRAPPSSLSN